LLLLALAACSDPSSARDARLVGVWELSRFDNLRPIDSPGPGEMANILYVFHNDHELAYFLPGEPEKIRDSRGNLPFKDRAPYELAGDDFHGFLGLTNDLSGAAHVYFPAEGEFEIRYPDGSIAVLKRISANPAVYATPALHCVPQTIRGHDYDPVRVAQVREAMRTGSRDPATEQRLQGRWRSAPKGEMGVVAWLEFGPAGSLQTARTRARMYDNGPELQTSTYTVRASHLVLENQCHDPAKVAFDGDELLIAPGSRGEMRLARTDEPMPTARAKSDIYDGLHVIVQACMVDGSAPDLVKFGARTTYSEERGGAERAGKTVRAQAVYESFTSSPADVRDVSFGVGKQSWGVELARLPVLTDEWTQWLEPHFQRDDKARADSPFTREQHSQAPKLRLRTLPFRQYLDRQPETDIPGC
jgi:hypothetical protein